MTLSQESAVVQVTGASGGLGASTIAAALARALGSVSRPSILVDLALSGGGLDVVCGVDHQEGLRWSDLTEVRGPVDPARLLRELPGVPQCRVLSAGWSHRGTHSGLAVPGVEVVADVLASLARSGSPMVVDRPREAACAPSATIHLVLTGTRTRQLADLDALMDPTVPVTAGLARHLTGDVLVATVGAAPSATLVAAIADHVGQPVIGHVPPSARLDRSIERGAWPGGSALDDLVEAVRRRLPETRAAA